jgi:hypothetical protein
MDKVVNGMVSSDEIAKLGEDLEDGLAIPADTSKEIYEDFSILRFNYTMEVLIKSVVTYLVRPKSCNGSALRDYKRALRILKFVLKETEELYEAEKEDE